MSQVKNVTQYSFAIDVAKPQEFNELLSHLKAFSECDRSQGMIPRYIWAKELGIDRQTIRRWENEIIKPKIKFSYHYYNKGRRQKKQKLDHYQRFFLSLIWSLMNGWVTGLPMTYSEVISYLEEPRGGKPRWMGLTRQDFEQWQRHYQNKQAS